MVIVEEKEEEEERLYLRSRTGKRMPLAYNKRPNHLSGSPLSSSFAKLEGGSGHRNLALSFNTAHEFERMICTPFYAR